MKKVLLLSISLFTLTTSAFATGAPVAGVAPQSLGQETINLHFMIATKLNLQIADKDIELKDDDQDDEYTAENVIFSVDGNTDCDVQLSGTGEFKEEKSNRKVKYTLSADNKTIDFTKNNTVNLGEYKAEDNQNQKQDFNFSVRTDKIKLAGSYKEEITVSLVAK